MDTKTRIEKLEKQTGVKEPKRKYFVILQDEAIPSTATRNDLVIMVTDERTRELTLKLINGVEPHPES